MNHIKCYSTLLEKMLLLIFFSFRTFIYILMYLISFNNDQFSIGSNIFSLYLKFRNQTTDYLFKVLESFTTQTNYMLLIMFFNREIQLNTLHKRFEP